MATFTALVKVNIPPKLIFCNTKVSGLGEILSSENFNVIQTQPPEHATDLVQKPADSRHISSYGECMQDLATKFKSS